MRNSINWRDIVFIKDSYYLEEFEISLIEEFNGVVFPDNEEEILKIVQEMVPDDISIYECDMFFEELKKKYNLSDISEIKTYLFDDIFLPLGISQKWDISSLGGYINNYNI